MFHHPFTFRGRGLPAGAKRKRKNVNGRILGVACMPVQKLNVVMLGGQGVGKSSLMAVLYNSLKTEMQSGPLIVNALGSTADRLEALYTHLMEFVSTAESSL